MAEQRIKAFRVQATATYKVGEEGSTLKWEKTLQVPEFVISNARFGLTFDDDYAVVIHRVANRIIDPAELASMISLSVIPLIAHDPTTE